MYELDLVLMLSFNMRRSRIFPKGGGGGVVLYAMRE